MSVDGNWAMKITSPMGERPASLELSGSESLTGKVSTAMGDSDLAGSLDGDAIEFKGEMNG